MAEFWHGRRVLITGCSGFIGANLAAHLQQAGATVTGMDLVSRGPCLNALKVSMPVYVADVTDPAQTRGVISHLAPEWVFHLAGMSHPRDCQLDPLRAWEANVRGTWNVLEACRILPGAGKLRAVVCASSDRVYGSLPKAYVPILPDGRRAYAAVRQDSSRCAWLEDDAPKQTEVYGLSKACVDLLVRSYAVLGLPVVALRHQNAFGPADPHGSHLVTGTICALLEGQAPTIRGDGTTIKGYMAVGDICGAYAILAEAVAAGTLTAGDPVNAAGWPPISVHALVTLLIGIAGMKVAPYVLAEDLSQSGDVEILDDSRLHSLGWTRRPLLEGLSNTYNWYKEHGGMAWTTSPI